MFFSFSLGILLVLLLNAFLLFYLPSSSFFLIQPLLQEAPATRQYDLLSSFQLGEALKAADQDEPACDLHEWTLKGTYVDSETAMGMLEQGGEIILLKKGEQYLGCTVAAITHGSMRITYEGGALELKFEEMVVTQDEAPKPTSRGFQVRRQDLESILSQPARLMQDIRVKPVFETNRFAGLRVTYLRHRSFLHVYGLQQNDVITGLNQKPFRSVADALNRYNSVLNMRRFSLDVIRGNEPYTLLYSYR